MSRHFPSKLRALALASTALCLSAGLAAADQVINDDLIVSGSICAGLDCSNGESFGFDTLRLKENNLRIRAVDTSTSASFPTRDWQITFNDSSNGGANKFSIDDIDGGRTPFTIEAGAPSHSLYVEDGGRVGFGTSTPVVEMHVASGDSPTLRLEQNGSSGFTSQTWDLAGNEANFFVRDVTNGSKLPFKIIPGAASDSLVIAADGDVGVGTRSPSAGDGDIDNPNASLHVYRTDGDASLLVQEASGTRTIRSLLKLLNNGGSQIVIEDSSDNRQWKIAYQNGGGQDFLFQDEDDTDGTEMALSRSGDLTISGGLITGTAGSCNSGTPCDRVFDSDIYTVPSIEEHAALMWQNKYLPAVGPTLPDQPVNVTAKVLTMLNELEHAHIYIEQLNDRILVLEEQLAAR